ncbi:MAG: hypothetical protein EPO02_13625 [Nitrospirae bacterium]|nr:MAG: hypothetical protein EPO02_13625 [Nitrospirota bacterium]
MPKAITQATDELRGGVMEEDKLHIKAQYDTKTKLAIASTDTVDRMGESIDQKGWDLKNYISNGAPILFAHNDKEVMIGNARQVRVDKSITKGGALVFEPDFHDKTDLAKAIGGLFEEGRMKTFSVGFLPIDQDGNTYTKQELLEISAVNVPANPEAQMMAYRSMTHKGVSKELAEDISGVRKSFASFFKGAIADELANPDDYEVKEDKMDDVFDIFCAFCDVYFDMATSPDDFTVLLKECISLLNKVANGTYPTPNAVQASFSKVLDKNPHTNNDVDNQAKAPSAAPNRKHLEERIAMAKIIARAAEILARDEKLPQENRSQVNKVIKRAGEIIISQHKEELKNG